MLADMFAGVTTRGLMSQVITSTQFVGRGRGDFFGQFFNLWGKESKNILHKPNVLTT